MHTRRQFLLAGSVLAAATFATFNQRRVSGATGPSSGKADESFEVVHADSEWRRMLTPTQYNVLRHEGTERPYSSPLNDEHRSGTFACAGCQLDLFSSRTKFDSHTGWPSFWAPLDHAIGTHEDLSFGVSRTEVHCRRCGGHLGHVFDDGPKPTGLRYCMNGLAMTFKPAAV
ncbi:peptide-methionine (R)-S-oxide reductase MsrB [Caballeronia mineralivorans]|uniref:peptide-methionine (R)-S-oxide reductase MsrB n=1 Tax=Caballeronia mineralivorans TaxID=2010198 RepID=UPI002B002F45|nr:peptide-methionine (R)-S-oxide reductase MsrB [Caballeronia mineralivorans]MEA3104127.1 peptide-methionine (R)-S-oxide reductase [Caballeronia mineralivorans]